MTLRGYGVLLLSILCGLGSAFFAPRFLLTLCAFFFATIGFSLLWMAFHKSKVTIERSLTPEFIYEDTEVLASLSIHNATTECSIRDFFDNGKKTTRFYLTRVGKDIITIAQYKFHVERRGVYSIGKIIVSATDALGLVAKE